jgi:hypothetical protein
MIIWRLRLVQYLYLLNVYYQSAFCKHRKPLFSANGNAEPLLTLDIVAGSEWQKCGLKYEICSVILFFFLLPLITPVVVPSRRPYCFGIEFLLNGFVIKKVSITRSPSPRGIAMTITSLILRFRCRPPIPTVLAPNCHCPFSLYFWLIQDTIAPLNLFAHFIGSPALCSPSANLSVSLRSLNA